jgi:adenylylsulfate kinase-like enzyme
VDEFSQPVAYATINSLDEIQLEESGNLIATFSALIEDLAPLHTYDFPELIVSPSVIPSSPEPKFGFFSNIPPTEVLLNEFREILEKNIGANLMVIIPKTRHTAIPHTLTLRGWKLALSHESYMLLRDRIEIILIPFDDATFDANDQRLQKTILAAYGTSEKYILHDTKVSSHFSLILSGNRWDMDRVFGESMTALLARFFPPVHARGLVLMLVGYSGSGKTTLAYALKEELESNDYNRDSVTILDGDLLRNSLSKDLGYSKIDRHKHMERMTYLASEIVHHKGTVIISTMAPFKSDRTKLRTAIEKINGNFVLVHLSTPLELCRKRDTKGLYEDARRGIIHQLSGIQFEYNQIGPTEAQVSLSGEGGVVSLKYMVSEIVRDLMSRGYIS